jgi:hypothetical protein
MKENYTLLILLLFCLKLSAFGIRPDTLKLSSPSNNFDSAKISAPVNYNTYSLKLTTTLIREDGIKLSSTDNNQDSLKLLATVPPQDIVKLSIPVNTNNFKLPFPPVGPEIIKLPAPENNIDSFNRLSSVIQLDSLKSLMSLSLVQRDSVKQQIKRNYQLDVARLLRFTDIDSLKQQVKLTANDTLKALIYTRIAAIYSNYDTINVKKKQLTYQNESINYTLLAIQRYAAYNDTAGLRLSFDNLAKVYLAQKKYSQAKWFILQSNTLSRAKSDMPNIIASLLTLSLVKIDIKDYSLAMRDLNEAMQISITTHSQKAELEILRNYALLYHKLKNYPKEAMALKKRDSLEDSIRKDEEAKLVAQNILQKKKIDSLQNKKKVYSSNLHKLYKTNSSKKIVTL